MASQYAHNSNIPEIVQVAFNAMVLNDTIKLWLSCRIDMNYMMLALRCLNWAAIETWLWGIELRLWRAQMPHLANPPVDPMVSSDLVEDLGFSDASPASSDEE